MVHGYSSKSGLGFDIFVGNSLMAMYSMCGDMVDARQVFDEIPILSAVSWTVMILGYARRGDVDLASILSACAHMGALDIGIWIHRCLNQARLPLSIRLSTSLLDMYAKCGQLKLAKTLFDLMPKRDIVCWNAMISGMAMHGNGTSALELFTDMEKAGIEPDDITFIAVFTACSYSGMAYEGLRLLDKMCSTYKIEHKSEHYGCIVDLLSRAGLFEEAMTVIRRITSSSNGSQETLAWRAFLSACCNHGQAQLAELAAERLLQLENHSGVYVLLSNLYTASGKHSDARRVRDMMKSKGADKAPGCSSVEIDGVLSEFIAGEKVHTQLEEIHSVLKKMHMQLDLNTPITRSKV
ncbi:hypothetical protein RIF29_16019 [Crotalaria pallida]|uniref:Pentatricopeptide repeat protein n=1 Tax=Crotalaria pallida TaxID=3830 RepID=A0AAN9FLL8_CROPI